MRKHLLAIVFGALFGCLFDVLVVAFFHGIDSPLPWSAWSAIPLFVFGTLWGPIALPFACALAFPSTRPLPCALEAWDEHGLRAWVGRGLLFGASLSWPLLVIPAASVELGHPHLNLALMGAPLAGALSMIGLFDRVRTAPRISSPRGRATTGIAFYGFLLPWCLALMTPNPIWRVDPTFEDLHEYEPEGAVRVEPVDAFFWTPGMDLITPSGSTFIHAPIALTSSTFMLRGRIVMPFVYGDGALYVPLAADGTRLDDSLLDRLLARTRFERFSVFAFLPFVPFFALAVLLRRRAPWRSVHASFARVEGVLDVRTQTLVATNSVSLPFEDGDVWTLEEGESLTMRFGGDCEPVPSGTRLEFIFDGAAEEGAFRASHRREALLDVRHAQTQTPRTRTRMPTDAGSLLVALYGAMLFCVWWVWSGV